ncbi:MAG: HD domain-containing protein [Nitrospina sp.]|nr:HD domain-containing protein [Nitrospina sp.]
MRITTHYIFSIIILAIYGERVCPIIESIGQLDWTIRLSVVFTVLFFIRPLFVKWVVLRAEWQKQPQRQFLLEGSLFLVGASLLAWYNSYENYADTVSSAKVFLGCITFGFFTACDMALERQKIITNNEVLVDHNVESTKVVFPITAKLTAVAVFSLIFMTSIMFLVFLKDLYWFIDLEQDNYGQGSLSFLKELLFLGSVILAEMINLIISFCRNLKQFFQNQNASMEAVSKGNLDQHVMISSQDEFSVMGRYTNWMIEMLKKRKLELEKARREIVVRLGRAAEYRDNETGMHVIRMSNYSAALARSAKLPEEQCDLILQASPMHDVGKIGIRDNVLLKPGKLEGDEWVNMKTHVDIGVSILSGGDSEIIQLAQEIAATHHEKYDGTGYPNGLKGEEISITGRIVPICDVFDALTSKRPYKKAWTVEDSIDLMKQEKGKHFDPDLVDKFISILPEILEIRERYSETSLEAVA